MKKTIAIICFSCLMITVVFSQHPKVPILKGAYIGQEPPGERPQIFAPGFISTDKNELNSVFSPDGKEFYFSIRPKGEPYKIFYTKETNNAWSKPEPVSFTSQYGDVDMFITRDGKRMYFSTKRPINGIEQKDYRIWYVERIGSKWSEAKYLNSPINDSERSLYPTLANNGTIYFQSVRKGLNNRDVYYAEIKNGKYGEPIKLDESINSEYGEGDILIAPDESFLIVNSNGRPDEIGRGDLYISFRNKDGSWTKLQNMGSRINSTETEYCPMLSPDGKYFFFTSRRTGNGDIYWVDAKIIQKLKSAILK